MGTHSKSFSQFELCVRGAVSKRVVVTLEPAGTTLRVTENRIKERTIDVSSEQLDELFRVLDEIGATGWFCHHRAGAAILDGFGWHLRIDGVFHEGANAFPPGFDRLVRCLEDTFGIAELAFADGCEHMFGQGNEELVTFIARSAGAATSPESRFTPSPEMVREWTGSLLHDLDLAAQLRPELRNYFQILERKDLPTDLDEMARLDPSGLDADGILAMMVYIYRADRWTDSDLFYECMGNGLFRRWLQRLGEIEQEGREREERRSP